MARFSVGGDDEDGNGERPNTYRPFPKKPRISHPVICTFRRPNPGAASTSNSGNRGSVSTSGNPSSTSAAPQQPIERESLLREPVLGEEESEGEIFGESDSSWSGSSSEEESEERKNRRRGDEVQPSGAQGDSTPDGNGARLESDGPTGGVSVTLTDPHVLDCPFCLEPLCSPVYQCENGHIACTSCCNTMRKKCANCCWPIGYNRCRAIEKVLESIWVACQNRQYGCTETLNYSQKHAHERTCGYAPCSCPHPGCDYFGVCKSLYAHFGLLHSSSRKLFLFNSVISISLDNNQKHVFLQERDQNVLFILTRSVESIGSFVHVICVAPNSAKRVFSYKLTASVGETSIKLKTHTECVLKWTAQTPAKVRLLVPSDFMTISGQLRLQLIIRGGPALAS